MAVVQNQRDHAVPLTIGLLGARQARNVDTTLPLEASLIADGTLVIVDNAQAPQQPTPLGTYKGTAHEAVDLPDAGNLAFDVRLVADDATLRYWDGEAWQPLTGGGGGAGSWKPPVATKAALPGSGNSEGDTRAVLADESAGGALTIYGWKDSAWVLAAGGGTGGAPGGGDEGEGDEVPVIIDGSKTLDDLGVGAFDGQRALIRVGSGDETHTEEMQWLASLNRWVGLQTHEMTRTADTWGMDFHNHPLADWRDAWCALDNPIIYGLAARSFITADCASGDGTLHVADTSQFTAAGSAQMRGQTVNYTGKTSNTLTGVTGVTAALPADMTPITQGNAGGWATSTIEMAGVAAMYAKGFTLEERLVAYLNGSRDDVSMSLTAFYWNEDLGDFYNNPGTAPTGGLGHGVVITGPASDLVPSEPGNRTSERDFQIVGGEGIWSPWSAATPNKDILRAKLYAKMNSASAEDNGEAYGMQLLLRWVGTP